MKNLENLVHEIWKDRVFQFEKRISWVWNMIKKEKIASMEYDKTEFEFEIGYLKHKIW